MSFVQLGAQSPALRAALGSVTSCCLSLRSLRVGHASLFRSRQRQLSQATLSPVSAESLFKPAGRSCVNRPVPLYGRRFSALTAQRACRMSGSESHATLRQRDPFTQVYLGRPGSAGGVYCVSVRHLHPVLLVIARQLAKGAAILTGRAFRKWWASLPADKRAYFFRRLYENRVRIAIGAAATTGASVAYYIAHLQTTPLTGRQRFVAFNSEQMRKIAEFEYELHYEALKDQLLPSGHWQVRRVKAIAEHLLAANRDIVEIYDKHWTVSVVNSPLQNAFVLPTGQIFVFAGMLGLCETDDQLGCVLAHEMAHAVLNHAAEQVSRAHAIDVFIIAALAAIWAVMPTDGIALVTQWFFHKVVDIMINLPYSRALEAEADTVGLQLAAKACLDVREASAFWSKMDLFKKLDGGVGSGGAAVEIPEFLSTHPANEKRSILLDAQMTDALRTRYEHHCPPLARADPRVSIEMLRQQIEAAARWRSEIARSGVVAVTIPGR